MHLHTHIPRSVIWVAVNIVGMALYLHVASPLWVRTGEEGAPGGPGDAFYWLLLLVPVLAAFFAFNSVALVVIIRRLRAQRSKRSLLIWSCVALLWVGTVGYDHHRSFRVIDAEYTLLSHVHVVV
jgi:hypothetical protein